MSSEEVIELARRGIHLRDHVVPQQKLRVEALCREIEQLFLERYPGGQAWVPLGRGRRLHFNDQGLTVESHLAFDEFQIPATKGRPARKVSRQAKYQPGYSVEALLECEHSIRVDALFQFEVLHQAIIRYEGAT